MAPDDEEIDFTALRELFLAESMELLSGFEEAALALEEHPDDPEYVETMFRAAHTIKGNSRLVGFDHLGEFTHAFEGLLHDLRDKRIAPTHELTTLVLTAVDALRKMIPAAVAGAAALTPEEESLKVALAGAKTAAEERAASSRTAATGSGAGSPVKAKGHAATIRVPVEKLDRLMDLVGEMAISRGRVAEVIESVGGPARVQILEARRESDLLYLDLQELVMKMRMVPLGPLFHEFFRTVRDLSNACGKPARLVIEGEDVEVDTSVVEHLRDPLMHLIRNAVNHGLENYDLRSHAGKPAVGQITLNAFRDAGGIVIQVTDDGIGLDRRKILARARSMGFVRQEDDPPDGEVYRLIFEPGFSTAEEVTEISGRGVGMDVVRRNVEQLRGSVDVESRPGEGATVTMRFPLTLAIIEGFRVGVGQEVYIVPMDTVVECLELPPDREARGGSFGVMEVRGGPLPVVSLRALFSLDGTPPGRQSVLVVQHGDVEAGLVVDEAMGEAQVVIKPLGRLFHSIPGLSGTSIQGDGRVAFVLDVPVILKEVLSKAGTPAES